MPRHPRVPISGYAKHIIQRGNNRQPIFACDEDIKAYAFWLGEYAKKFEVLIHAWVLMTNYVQLLFPLKCSKSHSFRQVSNPLCD